MPKRCGALGPPKVSVTLRLFDAPLSNLDAALRVSTRVEIARLHRTLGATMIFVTHDQIEAMTLADRIVVMNHGRVAEAGQPLDLYYRPANLFVAGFIGSPAMNFFDAAVMEAGDGGIAIAGPGGPAALHVAGRGGGQGGEGEGRRPPGTSGRAGRAGLPAGGAGGIGRAARRNLPCPYPHCGGHDADRRNQRRGAPAAGDRIEMGAADRDVHLFDAEGLRIAAE